MPTDFIGLGELTARETHFITWLNAVYGGNYTFIAFPFGPHVQASDLLVKLEIINVVEVRTPRDEYRVIFKVTNNSDEVCRYSIFLSFDPPRT